MLGPLSVRGICVTRASPMKNILSRSNGEVLAQFAWSNSLLAFDFDGTLAPIVGDPAGAHMRQRTRELLSQLSRLAPVVVISGRARADARERVEGLGVVEVIGSHGVEPGHSSARYRAEVRRWLPVLEQAIAPLKGVAIEDKTYSLAIHYRRSRAKREARAAILGAVAGLGDVRIVGGKQVINVLPNGAPHKGIALLNERNRLGCDTAIYVGDDETDEDVFALDQPGRLLAIRVGDKRASAASYCIRDQRAIDRLLEALITLRTRMHQHARTTP